MGRPLNVFQTLRGLQGFMQHEEKRFCLQTASPRLLKGCCASRSPLLGKEPHAVFIKKHCIAAQAARAASESYTLLPWPSCQGKTVAFSSNPINRSNRNSWSKKFLQTVPATPGDKSVAIQLLQHPDELLRYVAESVSSFNLPTLQQTLRKLARASKNPAHAAFLQKDERLTQLLQQIGVMLCDADGRLLSQVAGSLALLRVTNLATQHVRRLHPSCTQLHYS